MKHRNGFLYLQNVKKEWRLVLPSTCNTERKNFLEVEIANDHTATMHDGIKKTMKALTDKIECQSFSYRVRECVGSCDICQRMKYSQRGPVGYVTALHVPVRP